MNRRRAIVVGTGAGGLAAAAYLARDGFEVTAVEQADRLGGYLAPFSSGGYSFDPGLHYVGQARPGQYLDEVLGELGLEVDKLFVELDPQGFDAYRFPDFEVRMCRGLERYRDRLIDTFPTEREGLLRVFELIAHFGEAGRHWPLAAHSPGLKDLMALRHLPPVLRWAGASFEALLGHFLHDHRARAVLAAPGGDAGLPPSRLPALLGLGLLAHYLDGAFYPRGGSGALRDALVACAQREGAAFRTGAEVVQILTRGSTVRGVRLASGEELPADVVVSDVDPTITFGKLLSQSDLPGKLRRKVEHVEPSISALTLFLGMRRDLRSHGLGAFNVWQYPSWDLEALYAPVLEGRIPRELTLFLSSSTLRDDSGTLAPAGCSTLQVVALMPWKPFAPWAGLPPEQRGDDYRQLRRELADRVLATLEQSWPGLVGDVEVERVSTPLSNTDYTRAVQGGLYGPAQTRAQSGPGRFASVTPLRGLFLAGAGVNGGGVATCLSSGRIAATLAAGRRAGLRKQGPRARGREGLRPAL